MGTNFLFIFTFLFLQTFGSSTYTMMLTSSNVTCIEKERQSLLLFKQRLTDESNRLSTWRGVECCKWKGVECDMRSGHVVKLDLRASVSSIDDDSIYGDILGGELSPALQNLKHLRYLDLSMNDFLVQIPEFFGSFKLLEYLNLSCSSFSGVVPHHLGNLSRLQYLDLANTYSIGNYKPVYDLAESVIDDLRWVSSLSSLNHLDLTGILIGNDDIDWFRSVNMLSSLRTLNLAFCNVSIHSVRFVNFSSLNSLDLSNNEIVSTIPVWLLNLTSLTHLNFHRNHFHGQIPEFLGTMSSLEMLDLSSNELVGYLSEIHFTKLKNLTLLWLSENSLAWNVSSQWIPPFQLEIFLSRSCNIGPRFPNWFQTQTNIKMLDLYNSSIRDTIPKWFENFSSHIFVLDLSHNQISGNLPRFHSFRNGGRYLMMNSNKFEGSFTSFPPNVTSLDLSDNMLQGQVPYTDGTMNPYLEAVNLSKNRFAGSIPMHLCNISSIRVLDLSHNKFSGRLPWCLGNLPKLQALDVTNNTLTGIVPSSLGYLRYLKSLHLQNNRFEGYPSVSLQNLTELVTLGLGNNFFTGSIRLWIGVKMSKLIFLNLQSNKFTGHIPQQICQLKALQLLNLAQNNITGMIPLCFGNLSGMITNEGNSGYTIQWYDENIFAPMKGTSFVYKAKTLPILRSLDLSSNNIIGEIPDVLMNLVGLQNLNLSGNLLEGQIPMKIGDLKQLESLDLSKNKLSGSIPQSLSSLTFINHLNFAFNNLSGQIPTGNQLQILDDPYVIYEGNNGLCGPPVRRNCKNTEATYNDAGENEDQDDTEGLWFYVGMGPGFVVGFMGILGSLHFIRSWRVTYFEMLENVYGWLMLSILLNIARLRRSRAILTY